MFTVIILFLMTSYLFCAEKDIKSDLLSQSSISPIINQEDSLLLGKLNEKNYSANEKKRFENIIGAKKPIYNILCPVEECKTLLAHNLGRAEDKLFWDDQYQIHGIGEHTGKDNKKYKVLCHDGREHGIELTKQKGLIDKLKNEKLAKDNRLKKEQKKK